jgi:hypothetical protein
MYLRYHLPFLSHFFNLQATSFEVFNFAYEIKANSYAMGFVT